MMDRQTDEQAHKVLFTHANAHRIPERKNVTEFFIVNKYEEPYYKTCYAEFWQNEFYITFPIQII
jgi:hypothetical protein